MMGHSGSPVWPAAMANGLTSALDPQLQSRQLRDISTMRQGTSLEVSYDIALATTASPDDLVKRLYQLDGIHAVELRRRPDVVD